MKDFFTLPNPKKIKMERMDKYTGYMKDTIFLGHKGDDGYTYPPGAVYMKPDWKEPVRHTYKGKINLRDEQRNVFNKSAHLPSCLIEARTGSGKTVIALALADHWDGNTLIIVHSKDMVLQFTSEAKKFLGINAGAFFSGKKELKPLTITTLRSFTMHYDAFVEYGFKNIIRDEADLEFTDSQRSALSLFPAMRKFAFTGTIKTEFDDHCEDPPALARFYGKHVLFKSRKETPLASAFFVKHDKNYTDEFGIPISPQNSWAEFRAELDKDMARKKAQARLISNNIFEEDRTIVLFDRVSDTELFQGAWDSKRFPAYVIHGSIPDKARKDQIRMFKESGGVMFAQYKTTGRGFDVPPANKVFIMFPVKDETNMRQMIGRVIREYPGKKSYIYWFSDSSLWFQHRKRMKAMKEYFPTVPIINLSND